MRTAPSAQFTELVESRELRPIPIITLTAPGGTVFRWSDGPTLFDGNDIQPFLIGVQTFRQSMDHLPSERSFGELYRNYIFDLRNGEVDDIGTRLSELLRAANPIGGTVEYQQVLIDRRGHPNQNLGSEADYVAGISAANYATTIFRGTLEKLGPITNESIQMRCTSEQLVGGLEAGRLTQANTDTDGIYDAIGARHSVVYGRAKRVRCLPVKVGAVTALAGPITPDATTAELTRIDGFSMIGEVYIGGELISYTNISGNSLTGMTRVESLKTEHFAGESVVEVPSEIVFSAAAEASLVEDVYVRNPSNGAVLRVGTPYTTDLADSTSIPGQTFSAIKWTDATWKSLIESWVANARETQQVILEDTPATTDFDTDLELPPYDFDFQDQSRAEDGNWTNGNSVWTYAAIPPQGPKNLVQHTHGAFPNGSRELTRVRIVINITVNSTDGNITKANFLGEFFNPNVDLNPLEEYFLGIFPEGQYQLQGAWRPAFGLTASDLDGTVYRFGWQDVSSSLPDSQAFYIATVDSIGLEYEYAVAGTIIEPLVPAAIEAQSGAAGAEVYADLLGPDAPEPVFSAGYDFDDGTGWNLVQGTGTHSDQGTAQRFEIAPTPPADIIDHPYTWPPAEATNWVEVSVNPSDATANDNTVGGSQVAEFDSNTLQENQWNRLIGGPHDWSAYGQIKVDVYMASAGNSVNNPPDGTWDRFRFGVGDSFRPFPGPSSAGTIEYTFFFGDAAQIALSFPDVTPIPYDTWTTITLNWANPELDPHFQNAFPSPGQTEVRKDSINQLLFGFSYFGSPPQNRVAFRNLRHPDVADITPVNVSFRKNIPASTLDLETDDDRYEIDILTNGIVGIGHEFRVEFTNTDAPFPGPGPVNEKHLSVDPGQFPPNTLTTIQLTAINVNPPVDADDVRTIEIWLELDTLGGYVEISDLRKNTVANPYSVPASEVLEHPVDVLRHYLTQRVGLATSKINEASFTDALANLGDNVVAANLTELGEDDASMLKQFGFEHRFQLVQRDTDVDTEYVLLTQKADRTWPLASVTITEWQDIVEELGDASDIVTRRGFVYRRDPSVGDGLEAFEQALQVEESQNDLDPALPTALLTAAENDFGIRLGGVTFFYTIRDEDTARDVAEFWTREELSTESIYTILGVPWTEAYMLERGDIISLGPPWSAPPPIPVNLRILAIDKPESEFYTIIAKEVVTS